MQTVSVLSRTRLPNALFLRPAADGGGFAFSGVTWTASSLATGSEEREPLCCARVAPWSAMSWLFARRADFPATVSNQRRRHQFSASMQSPNHRFLCVVVALNLGEYLARYPNHRVTTRWFGLVAK